MKTKYLLLTFMLSVAVPCSLQAQSPTGSKTTASVPVTGDSLHVVKEKETLYSIARIYNTSVRELHRLNPASKQGLRVGDTLSLPAVKVIAGYKDHVIRQGETLYSVSRGYKVSIPELMAANTDLTRETFHTGKTIRIPLFAAETGYHRYTVNPGETLYDIARINGVSMDALVEINHELRTQRLRDSMVLVIPAKEANSPLAASPYRKEKGKAAKDSYL